MSNLQQLLVEETSKVISNLFHDEIGENITQFLPAEITQATQDKFGHYQCNSSMRLAKFLKKNPREIATVISNDLKKAPFIHSIEVAGPGFINITLSTDYLSRELNEQLKDSRLGIKKIDDHKKVVIDFSSPNVAKELHVGHLRSTIIGDSLSRLLEFLGYDVLRLNHVGDFGTQFGMLINYLKINEPEVYSGEKKAELSELMHWYRESKKLFDADVEFKKNSQLEAKKLQQNDPASKKAWEIICEISRKAYGEIYSLLDISLEERGESFYQPFLEETIKDLEEKNLVTVSEGAKCIFLEGFEGKDGKPFPLILQKSDGGYNYSTTDMAAIRHRSKVEKAQRLLYVVDLGQKLHLEMIFAAAEKACYIDRSVQEVEHVGFGVVLGSDGKKFKTRSGETERLIDLINEAISRAKKIMTDRLEGATEEEITHSAKVLGIDAIKYADLSCYRTKDYVFSYDRMLNFEGNTAAFLLYSYVRIQSIKRKSQISIEDVLISDRINLENTSEIDLGLHLLRFSEALKAMDAELLPNRLCDYLYTLAEKFNVFFRDCQVIGSNQQNSRLLLAELAGKILSKGLNLLGLQTLEKM